MFVVVVLQQKYLLPSHWKSHSLCSKESPGLSVILFVIYIMVYSARVNTVLCRGQTASVMYLLKSIQ